MSRWLHAQIIQYPESANGTLIILDDCSSAEEVDLFNNMQNIVITNTERGVWQQIGKVNLNAHSPNPGAPEHLAMVNNLLGDNAKNKHIHDASNLGKISQAQWRGLREHVLTLLRTVFPSSLVTSLATCLCLKSVLGFQLRVLADTASFTAAIPNDRDLRTLTKTAAPSELNIFDVISFKAIE